MGRTKRDIERVNLFSKKTIDARGLNTRQRMKIASDINRRSFFSANIVNENILSDMKTFIGKALTNKLFTKEKFIKEFENKLFTYDLSPKEFDNFTDSRLALIFETQLGMAKGEAEYDLFTDPIMADVFPCQELVRVSPRKEPRDWEQIWEENGGEFYNGRMIATRDSPIWLSISDFGNPFPPFKYNSGMGVEQIGREEAINLGIIDEDYNGVANKEFEEYFDAKTNSEY